MNENGNKNTKEIVNLKNLLEGNKKESKIFKLKYNLLPIIILKNELNQKKKKIILQVFYLFKKMNS